MTVYTFSLHVALPIPPAYVITGVSEFGEQVPLPVNADPVNTPPPLTAVAIAAACVITISPLAATSAHLTSPSPLMTVKAVVPALKGALPPAYVINDVR